jgi:hypothetical protein
VKKNNDKVRKEMETDEETKRDKLKQRDNNDDDDEMTGASIQNE